MSGGQCSLHHFYELQVLDPWRDLDMGGEEERDEKQEEGEKLSREPEVGLHPRAQGS